MKIDHDIAGYFFGFIFGSHPHYSRGGGKILFSKVRSPMR